MTNVKEITNELADAIAQISIPNVGENVSSAVIEVSKNAVYLDLGPLGIGVVRGRELWEALDSYADLKPGDDVTATIQEIENEDGIIELSFRQASRDEAWEDLENKMENNEIFETKVTEANRGGLLARVNGIPAFLPVSQLSSEHYPRVEGGDQGKIFEKLKSYIGIKMNVQVITSSKTEEKLIISEKKAEFEKQKEKMGDIKIGDVIEGEISGVVDFGAFIKFNGLEGLIHISELAWQRIDNPADIISVAETVKAEIIGIEDTKITLSLKRLRQDPWSEIAKKYTVGSIATGTVIKTTPYGGFVKLDSDIHGLVHISEISSKKVNEVTEFIKAGDVKDFKILSIEPENHRLGLSLKAVTEEKEAKKEKPETKE